MMSEMVNMAPPWQGLTQAEVCSVVASGLRPEISAGLAVDMPSGWSQLMNQCWNQEPTQRPQFKVIHELLDQIEISSDNDQITDNSWLQPSNDGTELDLEVYHSFVDAPASSEAKALL